MIADFFICLCRPPCRSAFLHVVLSLNQAWRIAKKTATQSRHHPRGRLLEPSTGCEYRGHTARPGREQNPDTVVSWSRKPHYCTIHRERQSLWRAKVAWRRCQAALGTTSLPLRAPVVEPRMVRPTTARLPPLIMKKRGSAAERAYEA